MTELPAGWESCLLDEINDPERPICYGILMPGPNLPDGIPYVKVRNIRADKVLVDEVHRTSVEIESKFARSRLRTGDVLVSIRGTYGRTASVPAELDGGNITQDTARVAPVGADAAYVRLFMQSPAAQNYFKAVARGVAVKGVNIGDLRKLPVPVAPVAEQERIVVAIEEAISQLDAGEAGLRTVRQLLKRMRGAILAAAVTGRLVPQDPTDAPATKLLAALGVETHPGAPLPDGWAWAEVGALLARIEAGKSFATLGRPAEAEEIGVIKVSAMTWGEFRSDENKAVPSGSRIDPNWMIRAGDLLFSRANTSEYVGACVIVGRDHPNLILSDKSLRLVPEPGVSSSWLLHYLRSAPARSQIEDLATGTKQSMHNISQAKLRSILIALPPTEEQARIVTEVERQFSFLDACDDGVDAGMARSSALRRSVLKAAFEGRLMPQDPSDEPASVVVERIRAERAAAPRPARRTRRTA